MHLPLDTLDHDHALDRSVEAPLRDLPPRPLPNHHMTEQYDVDPVLCQVPPVAKLQQLPEPLLLEVDEHLVALRQEHLVPELILFHAASPERCVCLSLRFARWLTDELYAGLVAGRALLLPSFF